MNNGSYIAEIAALLGDPARANMLSALMDGGALSAGDLAFAAHVTAQTASAHLAKLVECAVARLREARTAPLFPASVGRGCADA